MRLPWSKNKEPKRDLGIYGEGYDKYFLPPYTYPNESARMVDGGAGGPGSAGQSGGLGSPGSAAIPPIWADELQRGLGFPVEINDPAGGAFAKQMTQYDIDQRKLQSDMDFARAAIYDRISAPGFQTVEEKNEEKFAVIEEAKRGGISPSEAAIRIQARRVTEWHAAVLNTAVGSQQLIREQDAAIAELMAEVESLEATVLESTVREENLLKTIANLRQALRASEE